MTYATLKEGVFHLFEHNEKDHSGDQWKENDAWNKASESAIVAEDQDMVKSLLYQNSISAAIIESGQNVPLAGYRIEVKEVIVPSYVDKYGDKTAKLIKDHD